MLNPIILIYGTKIFMETFAMTFVFAGLLATMQMCRKDNKINEYALHAAVAIAIVGASFAKSTTIGIMAVMIYAMYAFFANKKKLGGIIMSAAVSAGIILAIPFLTEFPNAYFKLYMEDFFIKRFDKNIWFNNLVSVIGAIIHLVPAYIIGWSKVDIKKWKNKFLLLWIAPLLIIALKTPYVWYAYYFILPLSIVALAGINMDKLDIAVIAALIIAGIGTFAFANYMHVNKTTELKTIEYISENVSNDSCVLYAGAITPMIYSYLEHNGYNFNIALSNVLWRNGTETVLDANLTNEQLNKLVHNYTNANFINKLSEKKYLFSEWNSMSDEIRFITENDNCTMFDYAIITDYYKKHRVDGYRLVYSDKQITVWKKMQGEGVG